MSEFESLIEAAKAGDLANVKTVLESHAELINQRDQLGATALHYAAFGGHRSVVQELARRGAEINARDTRFSATPTAWAIEYLREMGGFLAIEMDDLAHAIKGCQVEWVRRFLRRFPALRDARDAQGNPFKLLARQCGNQEIANLFTSTPAV